jgi:hypothetical protein
MVNAGKEKQPGGKMPLQKHSPTLTAREKEERGGWIDGGTAKAAMGKQAVEETTSLREVH